MSRLRQRLDLQVSVKDIFTYKTIERLYDHVLSKTLTVNIVAEQGRLSGEFGLLPIQQWFFENDFPMKHHWNQSFLVKTPDLEIERLRISVAQLIEYHDGFRLRYQDRSQYYDAKALAEELKVFDIRSFGVPEGTKGFDVQLQDLFTDWQSAFNLERGPTYNIGYLYGYKDGSARMYFALHHLIVDAISWRILIEDLRTLYDGQSLGAKGSSYRQWVNALTDYGRTHQDEKIIGQR